MKEYVTVPDELLQNTDELRQYLDISYEYIKSPKPKPTKKSPEQDPRGESFQSCSIQTLNLLRHSAIWSRAAVFWLRRTIWN